MVVAAWLYALAHFGERPEPPSESECDDKKPGGNGHVWKWIHRAIALLWLTMAIPTLLWWRNSILWVCFMSLYANVASHWSAAQAAEAEEHADN